MWIVFLLVAAVFAKSPEEISRELNRAQRDFDAAEQLFIPWYTGPIITGSASNVPKGRFNLQGYLYGTAAYGVYADNRKPLNQETIYQIVPVLLGQYGLSSFLDATLTVPGSFKWQGSETAQGVGDITLTFGLQLSEEMPYFPAIRATIGETFPSGKYSALSSSLEATGAGVYATRVGLNLSKVFWWMTFHPVRLRLSNTYVMPNNQAHVEGVHAYGTGSGRVRVGNTYNVALAGEVSLTQNWAFATDLAYTYGGKNRPTGNAIVESETSDQLSLAPAIEYNFTNAGGLVAGAWFTLTGRNASSFVSAVISYTHLF